jgi:hypothetical protein
MVKILEKAEMLKGAFTIARRGYVTTTQEH